MQRHDCLDSLAVYEFHLCVANVSSPDQMVLFFFFLVRKIFLSTSSRQRIWCFTNRTFQTSSSVKRRERSGSRALSRRIARALDQTEIDLHAHTCIIESNERRVRNQRSFIFTNAGPLFFPSLFRAYTHTLRDRERRLFQYPAACKARILAILRVKWTVFVSFTTYYIQARFPQPFELGIIKHKAETNYGKEAQHVYKCPSRFDLYIRL